MKVRYKLKQIIPMAIIAGATLLPAACRKTNPEQQRNVQQSTEQQPTQPTQPVEEPHHNTTYIWGKHYLDNVYPADKITKSVDSTLVDIVFLENDGSSWEGSPTTLVLKYVNKIIDDVKSENKHKIRGAGTLNDVYLRDEQARQDSITLSKMGFNFGNVFYPQKSK